MVMVVKYANALSRCCEWYRMHCDYQESTYSLSFEIGRFVESLSEQLGVDGDASADGCSDGDIVEDKPTLT